MSTVSLINARRPASIGGIQLDAVVNERHGYETDITQFPIEDGAEITDHIRRLPIQLSIDGIISDTPVQVLETRDTATVRDDSTSLSIVSFNNFLQIMGFPTEGGSQKFFAGSENFNLVNVVTGLRVYPNMAIKRFTPSRSASTGRALRFSIELVQVRRVTLNFEQVVNFSNINQTEPNGENKTPITKQKEPVETEKPDASTSANASLWKQLLDTSFGIQ